MGYGITIRVQGDYALFTRPEMKVERVSYDIITPSAARGIIEAIYWKPAIRWVIDRIHVLNEIQFTNIRRNEVSEKISTREIQKQMEGSKEPFYLDATNTEKKIRQQRASLVLKNVDYVIEAHFELTDEAGDGDTVEKHYNIALRRLRKGQHFHAPYLGTREFGARVTLLEDAPIPSSALEGERDLGWMLYDLNFDDPQDIRPEFFKAVMQNGVIDLSGIELRG
jgi:CRISPR-associated protein Cas5d